MSQNAEGEEEDSDSGEEFLHQREAERSKYDAPRGWYVDEAERRVRDDPDNVISPTDAQELFGVEVTCHGSSFDCTASDTDICFLGRR
jgi:hypothetical protein